MGNVAGIRDLRDKIENINALPTIPSVLKRLLEVIESPRVSLNEISNFISNDPALTTKILKNGQFAGLWISRQDIVGKSGGDPPGVKRCQGLASRRLGL